MPTSKAAARPTSDHSSTNANDAARQLSIRAAATAGLVGGVAFCGVEYGLQAAGVETPVGPVHLIPTVLGFEPGLGQASLWLPVLFIHVMVSLGAALGIGWQVHRRSTARAILFGAVTGLGLYAFSFQIIKPAVDTAGLGVLQHFGAVLAFAAYGAGVAWIYRRVQERLY
ncbi:hypothetical protein [Salisaeta longa]|uniref:hypothetical protein n=1 Tax=Salisaeta longa TaxID=503170 RepID=UPI00059085AB|nr:hypothetical protein [Salisaeta longa]